MNCTFCKRNYEAIGQKMKSMSPARREKVDARAAGLIAEELTLQKLQARKLTQVHLVKALGISQPRVQNK